MTDLFSASQFVGEFDDVAGGTIQELTRSEYSYVFTDVKSNIILGELPLQNVTYGKKLSAAGDASGSLFINPEIALLFPKKLTRPGRTGMYILRDGTVVWGGIVWKRSWEPSSRQMRIECKTFESYFDHVFNNRVFSWEGVDQLTIAQQLAGVCAPEVKISVPGGLSGVTRYKVAFPYEYKYIGAEINDVASLFDGFDWNVRIGINPDTNQFTRTLAWGYPALGISRDATNYLFEFPGNIKNYTVVEDATEGGTFVVAIGGGEGLDQTASERTAYDLITSGWPKLDVSTSYKDVFNPPLLDAKADSDLAKLHNPITVITATVSAQLEPQIGTYEPGDWARFRIQDEFIDPPIDMKLQITGYTVTINDTGEPETVQLELGGGGTTI